MWFPVFRYIRINKELEISDEILEAIETVCDEEELNPDSFAAFVNAVNILRNRFCKEKVVIDPKDKDSEKNLRNIIGRINWTYGNSIMEKFISMMIIEYHLSDAKMHKFLSQPNIEQKYSPIDKLNQIRRKVSHDTDDRFSNQDYEFYIALHELLQILI